MSPLRRDRPRLRRAWMAPGDSVWLGVRHRGGAMVVDGVLMVDGDLDATVVRGLFRDRLLTRFPELSRRPARAPGVVGALTGMAVWDTTLPPDLDDLISDAPVAGPMASRAVEDTVGALVSVPLDPWVTPWRVHVLRGDDRTTAVLVRMHHSIGDGVALVAVLEALMDDLPPGETPERGRWRRPHPPARLLRALRVSIAAVAVLPVTAGIFARATTRRLPVRDPGDLTCVAWSRAHDLAQLKAAARARGVKLNDVLLAAVAGGLRSHLSGPGANPADAQVIVPVDMRLPHVGLGGSLGNQIGVLFVRLPVSTGDPGARVAGVHAHTRRLKQSVQPASTLVLLRLVGVVPRPLQRAAAALLGRAADAVVTNVPGPTQERHLGGCRLRQVVFWVPRVGSMTLGVSVFSYAGTVTVGVTSSASGDVAGRAGELMAAIETELDVLALLGSAAHAR